MPLTPSKKKVFGDVNLQFNELEFLRKETMDRFFITVQQTLEKKYELNNTEENSICRSIFNRAVKPSDHADRRRSVANV